MNTFVRFLANVSALVAAVVIALQWQSLSEIARVITVLVIVGTVGYDIVYLFGNVNSGVRRRPLQNFVYRLYLFAEHSLVFARAADAFVDTLYIGSDLVRVDPVNEAAHPPRKSTVWQTRWQSRSTDVPEPLAVAVEPEA